jgi:hypothetical protein
MILPAETPWTVTKPGDQGGGIGVASGTALPRVKAGPEFRKIRNTSLSRTATGRRILNREVVARLLLARRPTLNLEEKKIMRKKTLLAVALALLILIPGSIALAGHGQRGHFTEVTLAPTPLAANAGLENATGTAYVQVRRGTVIIVVNLGGAELPEGSVLEGWVVDPGTEGGPGGGAAVSSVSDADEVYGTPFGDANIDMLVDKAAYALSTGVLRPMGNGTYKGSFSIDNNLTPYNAVVVTLESDGNGMNYDPRPGTPIIAGAL